MTTPPERDLSGLLAELLAGEQPSTDLLARHVRDPEGLAPEERTEVEAALARPEVADQVRVLQHRAAPKPVALPPRSRGPLRRRRWTPPRSARTPWLLAGTVAAAAVALWLLRPGPSPEDPGSRVARLPEFSPPARAPIAPPVSPRSASEGAPAAVPEASPPEISPPAPEPDVIRLAEREPDEPTGTAPTPESPAPEPEPLPAARPEPTPEPILVAMVEPEYAAPAGLEGRRRFTAAARGDGLDPWRQIQAIVPEHVAHTATAQPTFYWHLPALPPDGHVVEFSLIDDVSPEPIVETALPQPRSPGLQRVPLASLGVSLAPGVTHQWSIAVRKDEPFAPHETTISGWVVWRAPTSELDASLADAAPGRVPDLYARAGYWYDGFDRVARRVAAHPEDDAARTAQRALLRQVGLDPPE